MPDQSRRELVLDHGNISVIDPFRCIQYPARLKETPKGTCLIERLDPDVSDFETDTYMSPGWIDLHVHVYDGVASLSIPPDRAGLETGVHIVVDAGSAGESTLPAFRQYVVPSAQTSVLAWLNISSIGLVHLRELSDLSLINVDRTVSEALANAPFIIGIKVRSSGAIVGSMGLEPLKLARLAARLAGLPLMVHIGEAPPLIEDILDVLDEGDVITHCFHGKSNSPWLPDGRPVPALDRALERGVLLDIGHGSASFSSAVASRAISAGYKPHTISTDLHIRNIDGPVYDLASTMTKLMASGMSLQSVVHAVTAAPAKLTADVGWIDSDGRIENATIFRLTENGRELRDSAGSRLSTGSYIVPTGTVTNGIFRPIQSFDD